MFIHITANNNEVVFCKVSAACQQYGKEGYPVWMLHSDGSFSRMEDGKPYYRSRPHKLKKPMVEYTINDFRDILTDNCIGKHLS